MADPKPAKRRILSPQAFAGIRPLNRSISAIRPMREQSHRYFLRVIMTFRYDLPATARALDMPLRTAQEYVFRLRDIGVHVPTRSEFIASCERERQAIPVHISSNSGAT